MYEKRSVLIEMINFISRCYNVNNKFSDCVSKSAVDSGFKIRT